MTIDLTLRGGTMADVEKPSGAFRRDLLRPSSRSLVTRGQFAKDERYSYYKAFMRMDGGGT